MITNSENYKNNSVGKKAENLFIMSKNNFNVPHFFCISEEYNETEINQYLEKNFTNTSLFSVRSSSSTEDSNDYSFAGQFKTFLNVKKRDVIKYIKQITSIANNNSIAEYCKLNNTDINSIKMTVIIQEMIVADLSGVIFTANPQGILNETVIVVGCGTGDNIVEDKVDTTNYYYNNSDNIYYYEKNGLSPLLSNQLLKQLIVLSNKIKSLYNTDCDIEFSIKNNEIFILQSRPITTLKSNVTPIILDNSNIVESYPNITLPLTQSFIKEVYYRVFKTLLIHLTGEEKSANSIDGILQNMVDVVNGRVYYRISNWYDVILFLPFSNKIIPVWQEMMGVSNKTISSSLKNKIGFKTHFKVAVSFFNLILTNPTKMDKLDLYFSEVLEYFSSLNINSANTETLIKYYQLLKKKVTDKWDITLVNDMYTFIFTGLLKSRLKSKKIANYENVTNLYISKISNIESLKPITQLMSIVQMAKTENRLEELLSIKTNQDYYLYINGKNDNFTNSIKNYIETFGDRNVEELKLESKTFRTDPILLIYKIIKYAKNNTQITNEKSELQKLTGLTGLFAQKASIGIKNREKSRLNRSRLYGMMRRLMLKIGENFCNEEKINETQDIFWLFYDEIEKTSNGEFMDLKNLITQRKQKYEMFSKLPAYSRLIFIKKVFDKNPTNICEMKFENSNKNFIGVACSKGIVEGEILFIENPTIQTDTKDKIILTKMTDPGWVFLIAQSKGIISEKGSLLSHTAIISRELGKPAVVGIKNITQYLKTGDLIRLNGDTGEIEILNKK